MLAILLVCSAGRIIECSSPPCLLPLQRILSLMLLQVSKISRQDHDLPWQLSFVFHLTQITFTHFYAISLTHIFRYTAITATVLAIQPICGSDAWKMCWKGTMCVSLIDYTTVHCALLRFAINFIPGGHCLCWIYWLRPYCGVLLGSDTWGFVIK